jgi:putative membrane-bound dehydrogenase-like protein
MIRPVIVICAFGLSALAGEFPVCPPDWSIEVVAAAPQIKHPTVVCSAPDGRVFVAEDPMDISAPRADLALGRILCFHPGGKVTIFAEKLYAVFGMQYLEGRLYVLHNPKFSVFDDRDGVGTHRVELIESTNPNPWALDWNDHVPANFRLAMDGFFYIAVGDKGIYGAVGRDGKRVDLHGGGILRMRPDGTEMEVFCTGVRNILDVAINAEDEIFTYDNTDEMQWMGRLTHMVEGGFYGYPYDFIPRRPYTLWMMADYGGGAATGTLCYNEDALPQEYHGNLWLADFGKRQILRVKVQRDGATYRAVSREDVFSKVPADFYPVGIGWGAEGKSMYICDWQHRDTKENVVAGRLWKMSYKGPSQGAAKPDWYLAAATGQSPAVPTDQLVSGLSHSSHSVRLTAQRQLLSRGPDAERTLKELLHSPAVPSHAKWHAIWALTRALPEVVSLVGADDVAVARQALRRIGTSGAGDARAAAEAALGARDASLRFHAATALGRVGTGDSIGILTRHLDDEDPFAGYAIFTALNKLGRRHPGSWGAIAAELYSDSGLSRERAAYALRETHDESLVAVLSKMVHEKTSSRAAALPLLAGVHRKWPEWKGEWWAYHPVKSPPPEKSVEWAGTAAVLAALRTALEDREENVRVRAVEGIREAGDAASAARLREMFQRETNGEMKRALVEAFGALRDSNAGPLLVHELARVDDALQSKISSALGQIKFGAAAPVLAQAATKGSTNVRAAVLEALLQIGGESAFAGLRLLAGAESLELRRSAMVTMGQLKHPSTVPVLLEAYRDPETRVAAIEALAQTPDARAVHAYLEGLGDRNASLRQKSRKALTALRREAWPIVKERLATLSADALAELQRIYKDFAPAREAGLFDLRGALAEPKEYAEFAKTNRGDPDKGRKLFFDAGGVACSKCHAVKGEGGAVGPDLSTVGSQFTRDVLIESILYPGKAIREGYQQVMVELKNGDSVSGAVKADSAQVLTLQDAEGRLHAIRKADVAERRTSEVSLMPEGLHGGLGLEDFTDLIAYLESLQAGK